MRQHRAASRLIGAATALLTGIAAANATDCSRKDALGTSRVLAVDAKTNLPVGLKSFPQTLPLADHEVVLTFDDGPRPPNTQKVLAALARVCEPPSSSSASLPPNFPSLSAVLLPRATPSRTIVGRIR